MSVQTLMAQTRERRSEALSETEWRGRAVPVKPERVRLFLLAERDLDAGKTEASLTDLERHLMDCKDAIAAAKEELKNDPVTDMTPSQLTIISFFYVIFDFCYIIITYEKIINRILDFLWI